MSAQDYGAGQDSAIPRQPTSRSRRRRARGSVNPEPQSVSSEQQHFQQHDGQMLLPLEPGGGMGFQGHDYHLQGHQQMSLSPLPSGFEEGTFTEEYPWVPQHARTRSVYQQPPSYHRATASFYQPAPQHTRNQSASNFYFLQSPHTSPNLIQGPIGSISPLGAPVGSFLGARGTTPFGATSSAQRGRHFRGSSVHKKSPKRAHRHSHSLSQPTQSAVPQGFPGPLTLPHGPPPFVASPQMMPVHGFVPSPDVGFPELDPSAAALSQAAMQSTGGPFPGQEDPSRPMGLNVFFPDRRSEKSQLGQQQQHQQQHQQQQQKQQKQKQKQQQEEEGEEEQGQQQQQQQQPTWQVSSHAAHVSGSTEPLRRGTTKSAQRHNRQVTGEAFQIPQSSQRHPSQPPHPAILEATNPMSDFNFSSHGLGIGIGGPHVSMPSSSSISHQTVPTMASPQINTPPGTGESHHIGNEPVLGAQESHVEQLEGTSVPLELSPTLHSMPVLPPYVSYEQQIQQQNLQRQLQQHQQQHFPPYRQYNLPSHASAWQDEELWQRDYWNQRQDYVPVAGPGLPSHTSRYPYQQAIDPMLGRSEEHVEHSRSLPGFHIHGPTHAGLYAQEGLSEHTDAAGVSVQQPFNIPEVSAESERGGSGMDEDDDILSVPGPNYSRGAHTEWTVEDMEELMKLLDPAEKYKWRYMSDILTETRKKRIPLKTCQNKFHAMFGETESSTKLRSSLFYVAYRSGWDSIRESTTLQEREKGQSSEQGGGDEDVEPEESVERGSEQSLDPAIAPGGKTSKESSNADK